MRIHNISDRPNTDSEPRALIIGRQKIRPGQYAEVEDSFINDKVRALHGTVLWLGNQLPLALRRTSKAGLAVQQRDLSPAANPAMLIQEARGYLATLSESELVELCGEIVPPLVFSNSPPKAVLVARLGRALFMPGRVLNPQKFFWLRRWVKKGEIYLERE